MSEPREPEEPAESLEVVDKPKEANGHTTQSKSSISVAVSILAILGSVLVVLSNRASQMVSISGGRAKDQWDYYQLKRSRIEISRLEVDLISVLSPPVLHKNPSAAEAEAAATKKSHIDASNARIARSLEDQKESQLKAEELESLASAAKRQVNGMSFGQTMLQIAIILASITLYTGRRIFFVSGLVFGASGVLIALYFFFFN